MNHMICMNTLCSRAHKERTFFEDHILVATEKRKPLNHVWAIEREKKVRVICNYTTAHINPLEDCVKFLKFIFTRKLQFYSAQLGQLVSSYG